MLKTSSHIIDYTNEHRNRIQELLSSKVTPQEKKKYLSSMGIYEEKDTNTYMTRVRNPAGVVSLQELKTISELADLYSHGIIHFTTRQNIQFHRVTLENTADLVESLLENGLYTRGSGGNSVRNIACSTLSGVEDEEVFDVTQYALKSMEYLLEDKSSFQLPRKYKIAFSNSSKDTAYATIADLGFIAKEKDNQKGFEVYGGGGLGRNPSLAIKLSDFIPANEAVYYVFAMKDFFLDEGDRENRNRARIRYILYRLGEEEFKNRFYQYLEKARNKYKFEPVSTEEKKQDLQGKNLYIHPKNGFISTDKLNQIINFIESLDYQVSIRLTNTQGFYIRGLTPEDADKLAGITSEYTSQFNIDNSVSCVGASICKIGICKSQQLSSAIKESFKDAPFEIKSQLPGVFISGCHNSCGQHQIGQIGLSGKLTRTPDGMVPAYNIFFGGKVEAGKTKFGEPFGEIPAKKVPDFLFELASLKYKSEITDFFEFISKEKTGIENLIKIFSTIEPKEQNPSLYSDFGI